MACTHLTISGIEPHVLPQQIDGERNKIQLLSQEPTRLHYGRQKLATWNRNRSHNLPQPRSPPRSQYPHVHESVVT